MKAPPRKEENSNQQSDVPVPDLEGHDLFIVKLPNSL